MDASAPRTTPDGPPSSQQPAAFEQPVRAVTDGSLWATVTPKLARFQARAGEAAASTARAWLEQLAAEDAAGALLVAQRLDRLLGTVDGRGLGRWLLQGQRLHPDDLRSRHRYYALEDSRAVAAMHAEAAVADLHRDAESLGHLLAALARQGLVIQPLSQALLNGPPQRPVITPTHLLLPDSYTEADAADRHALYRAAVAHAVAHLQFSRAAQPIATLKPLAMAVVSAVEDARVERLLAREWPGVARWFRPFLGAGIVPGDLSFTGFVARLSLVLGDDRAIDDGHWTDKGRRLFRRQVETDGLEDAAGFRRLAGILANDLGQMRVRFDAQRFAVPTPHRDDHSYLWDHGPSQSEPRDVELQQLIARSPRRPSADATQADNETGRADALPPAPRDPLRHVHPEWDYRIGHERADWCTVLEYPPAGVRDLPGRRPPPGPDLPPMALPVARRISRRVKLRRQWEGDHVDLDAAIEVLVDRRMRLAPEARLFTRPGRDRPACAVLVLLDLSESANDRVGGTMRSVLDVEKTAAHLLVRSVRLAGDRIAVHGFGSDTRARVHYRRLVDFDAPPGEDGLQPLFAAQAALSTRLGAAVRHATLHLRGEAVDRRALIVVTDGAPSDVDVHDPRYLVEDAAAAVVSARRAGIECACVAVESGNDAWVRAMFGWRDYRVVVDPLALPRHLTDLYARTLAR